MRKYHRLALSESVDPILLIETVVKFVRDRTLDCPGGKFFVKFSDISDEIYLTQYEPKDPSGWLYLDS